MVDVATMGEDREEGEEVEVATEGGQEEEEETEEAETDVEVEAEAEVVGVGTCESEADLNGADRANLAALMACRLTRYNPLALKPLLRCCSLKASAQNSSIRPTCICKIHDILMSI